MAGLIICKVRKCEQCLTGGQRGTVEMKAKEERQTSRHMRLCVSRLPKVHERAVSDVPNICHWLSIEDQRRFRRH